MLTRSNWHKELRSNRYHYATRFAKQLPVIFIQKEYLYPSYRYENQNDIKNISLLHIFFAYRKKQTALINQAFAEKNIKRPLLWIYDSMYYDYIR